MSRLNVLSGFLCSETPLEASVQTTSGEVSVSSFLSRYLGVNVTLTLRVTGLCGWYPLPCPLVQTGESHDTPPVFSGVLSFSDTGWTVGGQLINWPLYEGHDFEISVFRDSEGLKDRAILLRDKLKMLRTHLGEF